MHRNKSVSVHQFAMIPRADIPRSSFRMQRAYKTTFLASHLTPVLCEEVLPGDTFNCRMTSFVRLATPLVPIMDNLKLESFFFFVPNRLVWENWVRFMGEQDTPSSSISFVVPQIVSPVGGYVSGSIYDYFGLPTVGQISGAETFTHSALPLRAFALIFNEWFRDENLVSPFTVPVDDGPDVYTLYSNARRGKRKDYFTGCLPWPQKGATPVSLPLGTTAPITSTGSPVVFQNAAFTRSEQLNMTSGSAAPTYTSAGVFATSSANFGANGNVFAALDVDLTSATAATINQIRQAFQIQRLLERDARGGTRYTELVLSHFGVRSPDARLQRPEYLGGGSTPVAINPIAQTSASSITGGDTPQGTLAAMGTALASGHGFTQSFTEHGYIIGMVNVRADITYQQGLRRHWSRSTRYDFYFPVFAMLGEQAVLSKEIFCDGVAANDDLVFGYQERWAEYRYSPSEITGLFRSTSTLPLDIWHLSEEFATRPVLNGNFINDKTTEVVERMVAVDSTEGEPQQFLMDCFFDIQAARPLPMYSVPGMIDHF